MPNWAGSSWYYLRYLDPNNDKSLADRKKIEYWMPVDLYNGGMEHTTLHLLYSRFWYKFLFDIGVVPTDEPYQKRTSHGFVLGEGGIKMSKSRGNVINPDETVDTYGADTLRLYEMFIGPFGERVAWDTKGILGVRRFLDKVWKLFKSENKNPLSNQLKIKLNQTIKKVSDDIENFGFNTAVSALMEFINHALSEKVNPKEIEAFCVILSPFAPHLCEEIWQKLGHEESTLLEKWPKADKKYLLEEEITIAIQVNGKLRDTIKVKAGTSEKEVIEAAKSSANAKKYLAKNKIKKEIYIKNRLVNFVV
jgi:leucyl-tRNA synthetase